jgi:hypothetical protein
MIAIQKVDAFGVLSEKMSCGMIQLTMDTYTSQSNFNFQVVDWGVCTPSAGAVCWMMVSFTMS